MSAYASSIPGAHLIPYFAFGPLVVDEDDDDEAGETEKTPNEKTDRLGAVDCDSIAGSQAGFASEDETVGGPTLKKLTLDERVTPVDSSPSLSSSFYCKINSARVDSVELLKSLTRRTASFISGSQGVSPGETGDEIIGLQEHEEEKNDEIGDGQDDGKADEQSDTTPYTHGICFEDTDSDDEEYSMYDYSEDFSQDRPGQAGEDDTSRSSEEDPSAIEFEMEISYQGRTYTATRSFPLFVKLRNDLLRELNLDGGGDCELRHGMHYRRGQRCRQGEIGSQEQRVPELPRVSREENSHESFALTGVAKSGFALLRATANMYIPEMEKWLFEVANAFPCSQSLSSFLWEPLSTMSDVSSTTSSCTGKPPLHGRQKSNCYGTKVGAFISRNSIGSLNSIVEEGHCSDESCHGEDISERRFC